MVLIDLHRNNARARWQLALLLSGGVLVLVLAFQLWRSFRLEAQLRETETERALLQAERVLQSAAASSRAFACVAPELRMQVRGDRIVVDREVAWLDVIGAEVDEDLIVQDRLDRAALAEFLDEDHAAAAREFDELLSGPLLENQRLKVLSAALWHARRAADEDRAKSLGEQFADRLAKVTPASLANETVASAFASAVRFGTGVVTRERVRDLLPRMPSLQFAGLQWPADAAETREHERLAARRDRMRLAQRWLTEHGAATDAGVHALSSREVLWSMPASNGVREVAVLQPSQWFDAVLAESRDGATFSWPARIEPEFGPATEVSVGTVPGIAGLQPARLPGLGSPAWLVPALAGLLSVAFLLAFIQHRRAGRRETEAIRAQAQFLTTVTHELKTPLAGIRLLGEMLAEGRAKGRESDYYELLVGESARLSLLIDNVLDLGRLERGERSYELGPVPLGDLVRETLRMFAPVLEQSGIEVSFEDDLLDALARIDRDAFVQAFVAVLDNARKYGAAGKRVEVRGSIAGDRLWVSVRDHGAGVAEGERESVFDRFVRGSEHQHGSTPGVGIGLYLARSIARRLGGDLVCRAPATGEGAEFQFSLQRSTT